MDKVKKVVHRAQERGAFSNEWLSTKYSFSFSDYYDPSRMGFGALRVLNDDTIAAGRGFGAHPHSDMEIITLVTSGALEHRDSSGGHGVLKLGDVQVMSAGSGVTHSEFNHSKTQAVSLFQIWIQTKKKGITPRYDQANFSAKSSHNNFLAIVSGDPKTTKLWMSQDAKLCLGDFDEGKKAEYNISKGNGLFVFVISGGVEVCSEMLGERDSIEISGTPLAPFLFLKKGKVLLIEVPL